MFKVCIQSILTNVQGIKNFIFIVMCLSYGNLQAKTILITAATGSLGEAIGFYLASKKYKLILAARHAEKLKDLTQRIQEAYPDACISSMILDFSKTKDAQKRMQKFEKGSIDGVVLIGPRPALGNTGIPEATLWQHTFSETFVAPLMFLKEISPHIKSHGSIVVMSGQTSKEHIPAYPNGNVMRLAWTAEIKNLISVFSPEKIRVNAVSPGPILTPFHQEKINYLAAQKGISWEEQYRQNVEGIPLKSYGSVSDVAHLVHFLLSDKSKHINGTNILLDGGESNTY